MKPMRILKFALWAVALAVVVALSLPVGIGALLATRSGTRPQDRALTGTPFDFGRSYRTVLVDAGDGVRVSGWLIPATGPADCAAVVTHGLFRDRREVMERAVWLAERGCHAFTPDLRNHGATVGGSTTLGNRERYDVLAAHDFLTRAFAVRRRYLIGVSMGGAASAAAAAAAEPAPHGVVLDSTFRSTPAVMDRYAETLFGVPSFPATGLARLGMRLAGGHAPGGLDVEALAAELGQRGIPVLVLAGALDQRAPLAEQEAIFLASPSPESRFLAVEGAGHGRPCLVDRKRCHAALADFLGLPIESSGSIDLP